MKRAEYGIRILYSIRSGDESSFNIMYNVVKKTVNDDMYQLDGISGLSFLFSLSISDLLTIIVYDIKSDILRKHVGSVR